MDVSLHDVLVHEFQLGRNRIDWLPAAGGLPEGYFRARFADDRVGRLQLRLLANSAVKGLQETQRMEYRNELKRIRFINCRRTAFAASSRLLRVASWSEAEYGENAGAEFASAARLAELVGEHYNGWPTSSYADVVGLYVEAANQGFDPFVRTETLRLLKDLKALEPKADTP